LQHVLLQQQLHFSVLLSLQILVLLLQLSAAVLLSVQGATCAVRY
jgi:hypothetical protein